MDSTRMKRPARVHIKTADERQRTTVHIDGNDMSSEITAVTWTHTAGSLPTATITFHNIEIDATAEGDAIHTRTTDAAGNAPVEFHAVDLATLSLQPDDVIVLRHEKRLSPEDTEHIIERMKRDLTGHKVLILEGGLDLSILRPADPETTS